MKKKFRFAVLISAVTLFLVGGVVASADTPTRASNIKSHGVFTHDSTGITLFDYADLVYLADEIDNLENTYKTSMVEAVNAIGGNLDATVATEYAFSELIDALKGSQSISGTYLDSEGAEHDLVGATADNLSLGTAAWVNGEYIVGNGADVTAAYQKGYTEGMEEAMDNVNIEYIYHTHTGSPEEGTECYSIPVYHEHSGDKNGGGCYGEKKTSTTTSQWINWHTHHNSQTGEDESCAECSVCGKHSRRDLHDGCSKTTTYYVINCGMDENTIVSYDIGCGKTEEFIESAIVTFK